MPLVAKGWDKEDVSWYKKLCYRIIIILLVVLIVCGPGIIAILLIKANEILITIDLYLLCKMNLILAINLEVENNEELKFENRINFEYSTYSGDSLNLYKVQPVYG